MNSIFNSPGQQQLIQLEDVAKSAGKGKWNTEEAAKHIRNVKWTVENPRNFVDSHHNKPIDGKTEVMSKLVSNETCVNCKVDTVKPV